MKYLLLATLALSAFGADSAAYDFRVLATQKTSTMEKEMNDAAQSGYRFQAVMGGDTAVGGKEAVVVMARRTDGTPESPVRYRLLATSKTSTMQKELQAAGEEGFVYRGQSVFQTSFGGQEVVVILEAGLDKAVKSVQYRVLATSKTSTMQKELQQSGREGFNLAGLTVAKTAFGGAELLSILQKVEY